MKFISVLSLLLLSSTFMFAQTAKVNRHLKNGGCDGYSSVSSWWSQDAKGNDVCNIKCQEPGRVSCPTVCATQSLSYGILIQQAEQMIISGMHSGTLYDTSINAYVTWVAVANAVGGYDSDFIVVQE